MTSFTLVLVFGFDDIQHLSSTKPSIYFAVVWLWNHAPIRSWNQPVLSNKGNVSCSRKQRGPLMGLEPTSSTLQVRRATHCATPSFKCRMKAKGLWFLLNTLENTTHFAFNYHYTIYGWTFLQHFWNQPLKVLLPSEKQSVHPSNH